MVGNNYNIILICIKLLDAWKINVGRGNVLGIIPRRKRELLMMILQIVVLSMLLGIGLLKESTNLKPKKVSFPAMR